MTIGALSAKDVATVPRNAALKEATASMRAYDVEETRRIEAAFRDGYSM